MRNIMLNLGLKIFSICIFILIFLCPVFLVHATSGQPNIDLQVPIFSYTKATNIAEYIGKIFEYALIAIIPLAIIVIMWGGILWTISRGNPPAIKTAKSYISSAILGLLLAASSYAILSFIGLTTLKLPGIEVLQPGPDEEMELYTFEMAQELGAGAEYGSVGGQCFPVPSDSLSKISWNFMGSRAGGGRKHCGIDIYTKSPANVIAIADGTVTAISRSFYECGAKACGSWAKGGMTGKVMINHGTFTVNYAEIDATKIAPGIKVGAKVVAGQFLGNATHCCMLHFEIYEGNVSQSRAWYSGNPKPAGLVDPTNTLKELQSKQCQKK